MMSALDRETPQKAEDSDHSDLEMDNPLGVDNTKKKGWAAKQMLIQKCQNTVGTRSSGKRPLNIVIIGPPGCGKSSLLNTIFASFSDESWNRVANYGSFGTNAKQVTQRLVSYKKEGYYTRKGQNSEDDDILMPTFIDINGFEDTNTPVNKELLNMVFYGRLTEYEKIQDVLACLSADGTNGAKRKYYTRDEYLVVDRIIFVCSLDPKAPLPIHLMECVSEAANGIRGIPVFGVMTKADKFDAMENDEVKERERIFRQHLGIPLPSFTRITNYCEDIDEQSNYRFSLIPKIDIEILKLMTQVFSSLVKVDNPEGRPDYSDKTKGESSESEKCPTPDPLQPKSPSCINLSKLLVLITIQVLLVAVILHFGMKPIITDEKVNTICANYDYIKSKHDATIDGLSELCELKDDIFKPPMHLLGGAILFVIIVPQIVVNFFFATSRN